MKRANVVLAVVVSVSLSQLANTQYISIPPRFEVASIKPFVPTSNAQFPNRFACRGVDGTLPSGISAPTVALGRCSGALNMQFLIALAFGVDARSVIGGPSWARTLSNGFQIEAKAEHPETTAIDELRNMFQALLIDRFRLKYHMEAKEVQGFALVIAQNGPKLKEVPLDTPRQSSVITANGSILIIRGVAPISTLVQQLRGTVGSAPIVDKTGLSGVYEYSFSFASRLDRDGPSVFTTVQDELGLKLQAVTNVPLDVFVIDSVEKPSGQD